MGKSQALISVIVPVYNVEKYVEKCILSIEDQTYKNLEIIVVNDGSADRSPEICRSLAERYDNIRVIDKPNGGLSTARNRGIEEAKGELIGFVDSDDRIEPTMYEELYRCMKENHCDAAECGVNIVHGNGTEHFPERENEVISGKEALKRQLKARDFDCIPRVAVWSRLYPAAVWENVRFPEGHVHEDYMVTCRILYDTGRLGIVNKGLYDHLGDNPDSITHAGFDKKTLFLERQYADRVAFFNEKGEKELEKLALIKYYRLLFSLYYRCHENGMAEEKRYLELIKNNRRDILASDISPAEKVKTLLLLSSPRLYCRLKKHQR